MERLSVRLTDHEFTDLDSMGGKNRTDNTKRAIKFAKKYKKIMDKKDGKKRANSKHKKKETQE